MIKDKHIKRDTHVRFSDAVWYRQALNSYVVIGGAGGIGSWLALMLGRMGVKLFIYDMDVYEKHNLGGQFAQKADIGSNKAVAARKNIKDFGVSTSVNAHTEKYDKDSTSHQYMMSGFDNMEARSIMFENWVETVVRTGDMSSLFIDGRLLAEQIQIFCVRPDDMSNYRDNYLFSDSEVEDVSCTFKQTSHSAAMIASFMAGFFSNHLANIAEKNIARAVPFKFEYFIPLNMMTDGNS